MKVEECGATKVCNICEVEKAVSEFYIRKGYVQKYCLECKRAKNRSHYNQNKQAYKDRAKVWAEDNRERRREIANAYDARNREKVREYNAARADDVNARRRELYASDASIRSRIQTRTNEWYHENKHRPEVRATRAELCAVRQRSLKQATPPWADKDEIRAVYEECQMLNDITGIQHNVDHIVPITSDVVCGLHVACNLRVIPAEENRSKGNKLLDELVSVPITM
jgi:hypothetical protein